MYRSALPLSHPWQALTCILMFCGLVATFVSHTVAAIILMPVISRIGTSLDLPEVVVMGAAFSSKCLWILAILNRFIDLVHLTFLFCFVLFDVFSVSAAMALPFSSFPNVNSLLIVDDFQKPYLSVHDFLLTGVPMSIISVILIATVGFGLISVILV